MANDPEIAATLIRAKMAADNIKQIHLSKELEISNDLLNKFLRRKVNLLDSDITRILKYLGLEKFENRLSAPASIDL